MTEHDKIRKSFVTRRPLRSIPENGARHRGCATLFHSQVEDAIAPRAGELVINKTSSGALSSTNLDQTLHNMGINSLAVCGLTTAVCVGLTARQTADRGFRVVMVKDASTEVSQEMHEAALLSFSHVFGQVRSTQELITFLADARRSVVSAGLHSRVGGT